MCPPSTSGTLSEDFGQGLSSTEEGRGVPKEYLSFDDSEEDGDLVLLTIDDSDLR